MADKKGGKGKGKVSFHVATIRKPQEEFKILVNNSNKPFGHVWLEKSEDGSKFIHPLEKLSVLDFVDKITGNDEPVPPLQLECTPLKIVEEVKDLKELAAKLRAVNEFAVDLEHNQYRSFQGLTCLMQISTRTEDFIVDTLKLRVYVGPHLREVFKDPKKKKVMHGADRDIVWLQRDFGIYVCNMFDTGQASRVLKLERNSLEYLLHHFCGITANKEYQNADWRIRPLPYEMIRYGREDTHYLLYIYDLMRALLLQMPNETESSDSPLVEVYKRSYDICMQLYEKELLTESSYLHIYGLQIVGFNAQQLAIVSGLFGWRDVVARAEDESTGYILPNKILLQIAKEKPVTISQLRRLLKSKDPYVERHLSSVISIIRHAMQNATTFEAAVQLLKERQKEMASRKNTEVKGGHKAAASSQLTKEPKHGSSIAEVVVDGPAGSFKHPSKNDNIRIQSINEAGTRGSCSISMQNTETSMCTDTAPSAKVSGAAVRVLKKPTKGFGALQGNAAPKSSDTYKKEKEEFKLEKIRCSVNLPFHSCLDGNELEKPVVEEKTKVSEIANSKESVALLAAGTNVQDIILLNDDDNDEEDSDTTNTPRADKSASEMDKEDELVSLSNLSTSIQNCSQSNNQNPKATINQRSEEPSKPFDHGKAMKFGDSVNKSKANNEGNQTRVLDSGATKKNAALDQVQKNDAMKEFLLARMRQAFPASAKRNATFR